MNPKAIFKYLCVPALVGIAILFMLWRLKRLRRQNRMLEEELRVIQPYHTTDDAPSEPAPILRLPDELPVTTVPPADPWASQLPDNGRSDEGFEDDGPDEEPDPSPPPMLEDAPVFETETESESESASESDAAEPEPEANPEPEPEPEPIAVMVEVDRDANVVLLPPLPNDLLAPPEPNKIEEVQDEPEEEAPSKPRKRMRTRRNPK